MFTRHGNLVIHTGHKTFIADRNSSQVILAQGETVFCCVEKSYHIHKGSDGVFVVSAGLPIDELRFSSYPWCHQDNLHYEVFSYWDSIISSVHIGAF